jgi:hypothetical protein
MSSLFPPFGIPRDQSRSGKFGRCRGRPRIATPPLSAGFEMCTPAVREVFSPIEENMRKGLVRRGPLDMVDHKVFHLVLP